MGAGRSVSHGCQQETRQIPEERLWGKKVRCSTSDWQRNSTGCTEEGCPEGFSSSKGACGGAAVKMDEGKATEGEKPGAADCV